MKRAIAITFALFVSSPAVGQENCSLKREIDGIKVFICTSEHEKLKSARAEFILKDTTLDELEKFLMKVELYPKWQYHIIEAKIIEKINDNEMICRTVMGTPWPVTEREAIVRFKKKKDTVNKTMHVIINSIDHPYPQNENQVRVRSLTSTWTVTSVSGSSLKIIYTFRMDPGGAVPVWIVNVALADGPLYTFRNLKEMLPKNKKGK